MNISQYIGRLLRSDYILHFLNAFFLKGIAFLLLPYYTHSLSIQDYGYLDLITTTSGLSDILFSLGLIQYFFIDFLHHSTREDKKKLTDRLISQYLVIGGSLYFIFMLLNIGFPGIIGINLPFYYLGLALMTSFVNFFQNMLITALRLRLESKKLLVLQVSIGLFNALFIILLITYVKKDIICILLPAFITSIVVLFLGRRTFQRIFNSKFSFNFSFKDSQEILMHSLPFVPNQLSLWSINNLNRFILVTYTSTAEVGIFGMASKFGNLFDPLIIQPFINAYTPKALLALHENKFKTIRPIYYLIALIVFIGLSVLLKFVLFYIIHNEFSEGLNLLPIFAMSSFIFLLIQIYSVPLIFYKMVREMLIGVFCGGVSTLILNFVFIPIYGSFGASVSSLGGNLIWLLVVFYFSAKKSKNYEH